MKRLLGAVLVCLLCAPFAIAAEKESKKPTRQGRYVAVAGVIVEIDAAGRMRPLAAEEKAALLKGLDRLLSRPTSGLPQEKNAAGETTIDVSDHFNHALITYVEDGEIRTECVEDINYALAILFPANNPAAATAKRETE